MGPNIEPCAIPDESIFTPCFLRFKYECTTVTASSEKLYVWSFVASEPWG